VLCKKWKVVRLLRQSDTSQAYLADHRNGCKVVLRVLHEHLSRDEVMAARFRREAYVANAIAHPAIVKVIDDDVLPDGRTVLVTDPVEGESLEDIRLAFGGRLPLDLALELLIQVLEALECAHAEGIVHRNLRPELVLVHRGKVKIADFGFARFLHSAEELTDTGMVLGRPQFLAPEQARGHRELVDAQSDVFAVGAMAFLLLSGQHVHPNDSFDEFLYSATLSSARSLRMAVGEDLVPDELVSVIDKALAFRKAERWLSAEELADALRCVLEGRPVEPEEEKPLFEADERTLTTLTDYERELLQRALEPEPAAEPAERPKPTAATTAHESSPDDDGVVTSVPPTFSVPPSRKALSSMAPPNPRGFGVQARPVGLGTYSAVARREDEREEPIEAPNVVTPTAPTEASREVFAPVDVTARMESAPPRTVPNAAPLPRPVPPREPGANASPSSASRLAVLGALFVFFVSALVFAWAIKTRLPHRARATEMPRAPSVQMGAVARR
jgi:serine/threonine-protein kinase